VAPLLLLIFHFYLFLQLRSVSDRPTMVGVLLEAGLGAIRRRGGLPMRA
jgi:hypothetical protein